jgi:hypothetical protein
MHHQHTAHRAHRKLRTVGLPLIETAFQLPGLPQTSSDPSNGVPTGRSYDLTMSRLRHLATVLTLMPSSRPSAAVVACASHRLQAKDCRPVDRCIVALIACVPSHTSFACVAGNSTRRSRGPFVPECFLPFQRTDRTIKPWDQITRSFLEALNQVVCGGGFCTELLAA